MRADQIIVGQGGRALSFSFEDMLASHGGNSPGGVAHAFKVLQRGPPLLDPDGRVERGELVIETAFGGPGARDAFEVVTEAVSQERFVCDPSLARPEQGQLTQMKTQMADRVMSAPADAVYDVTVDDPPGQP